MFRPGRTIRSISKKVRDNAIPMAVSLLLAFFMWGILYLSKDYITSFDYSAEVSSNLLHRAHTGASVKPMTIAVRASGFKLIKRYFFSSAEDQVIRFYVDGKHLFHSKTNPNMFLALSRTIKDDVKEAMDNDFMFERLISDTLYLEFQHQVNRKVPVISDMKLSFKEQYTSVNGLRLSPDSIVLYGDSSLVARINEVHTYPLPLNNLSRERRGHVLLQNPSGVDYSSNDVSYSIDVERFFEAQIPLYIEPRHFPYGSGVFFTPNQVLVKYRMPFNKRRPLDARDFDVYVDYRKLIDGSYARIEVRSNDKHVFGLECDPQFVQCNFN